MNKTLIACSLAMSFLGLSGCGADGDPADEAAADEHIGTLEGALCTDAGALNTTVAMSWDNSEEYAASSPSATYGTSACTGHFVVDVTSTLGRTLTPFATWADALPNTKEACPFALVDAEAWGWVPSKKVGNLITLPYWKSLGKQTAGGVWSDGGGFIAGGCSLGTSFAKIFNSPHSKIRVSAKAAGLAVFFAVPKKVHAGVRSEVQIF